MAGHSKWANIQHRKGKQDAKRGQVFTKLAKAITVAAREGGDPDTNFSLRVAIDAAKEENMPKDNIDRAIKRGTGEDKDAAEIVTIIYEGYGPGGIAVLVECLTDNTNRAVSDVKHIFSKYGGSMGTEGSVKWQFEQLAVVLIAIEKKNALVDWNSVELALIDAGASDIMSTEHGVEVRAPKQAFRSLLQAVSAVGIEPDDARLMWVANDTIELTNDMSDAMRTLYERLEELDDVHDIYTNEK